MAKINKIGNIVASCSGCNGSTSTFEYMFQGKSLGVTKKDVHSPYSGYSGYSGDVEAQYRLFRCAGCGGGALGLIRMSKAYADYPDDINKLIWITPEAKERLSLPAKTPAGLVCEFREGEKCMESDTFRAAAGMFRSVLDKTLRSERLQTKRGTSLAAQIDEAAKDGVITVSRQKKAHDEIRVLGNDVLHDEWQEIPEENVAAARHYTQRILEDFYDDRVSVLGILRDQGRVPDEDKAIIEQ